MTMGLVARQRKLSRRWMWVLLGALAGNLVAHLLGWSTLGVLTGLAILAGMRMCDTRSWADGWEVGAQQAGVRVRDRVVGEVLGGAPAGMVAFYAAMETEHVLAGHDGDPGVCGPCNAKASALMHERRAERVRQAGL